MQTDGDNRPRRGCVERVDGGDEAGLNDNTGEVIGTQGFYIDVTPTGEVREASISEAVAEIADDRAVIDQATRAP